MKKFLIVLALPMAIIGCSTTKVSTSFYDIEGNTEKKLDREFRLKGPNRGHALASAAIRFEPAPINFRETDDGCEIGTVKIRVIANITLPRWLNRAGANKELKKGFDGLAAYAKAHEEFHVKIAELAASDMEEAIKNVRPAKTCKTLNKRVDRIIKAKLRTHDQAQKAFDRAEQRRLAQL